MSLSFAFLKYERPIMLNHRDAEILRAKQQVGTIVFWTKPFLVYLSVFDIQKNAEAKSAAAESSAAPSGGTKS